MANNSSGPYFPQGFTEYPPRNRSEERPTNTTNLSQAIGNGTANGWAQTNIWGLHSASASATRDSSRTREPSQFLNAPVDIDGRKGSGSLVASSEVELPPRRTRYFGSAEEPALHIRSGISPARRNSSQLPQSQSMLDNMSVFAQFPSKSRGSLSGAIGPRPTNGSYNASGGQTGPRLSDALSGFGAFSRQSDENDGLQKWADSGSVHSPTDDRRGMSQSEYFGSTSSAAASRNGSLPGSRQSNEPSQFTITDIPYATTSSRSHNPSFSSHSGGRMYSDRQPSQSSDLLNAFGSFRIDSDSSDKGTILAKDLLAQNSAFAQQSLIDFNLPRQSRIQMTRNLSGSQMNGGSPTPDGWANGLSDGSFNALQSMRIRERGGLTPNGSDYRQSSHVSAGGTPPGYDTIYGRNEQLRPQLIPQALNSRLQRLQQEQQPYAQPPYPPVLTPAFRNHFSPYANQYLSNGLPMPPVPQGMQLNPAIPPYYQAGLMPGMESPRGPRNEATSIQSTVLSEYKLNNKNHRWELKDIRDHFVEFAGDQSGSRFIQQKLETANSDEKQMAFDEILPNVLPLMQDVFGNYVIQKFFEHGDQTQKKIMASRMEGQVVSLSTQMYGCRVVQKALEHVLVDQQIRLANELEPHVMRLVKDQNGNHVIQKAIERVPHEHIGFIFEAFRGQICTLANHAYGCRVIQRILEKARKPSDLYSWVVHELHQSGSPLITDQYGNYVTQALIEHGLPEDREKVVGIVKQNMIGFSRHKFASNVVEKCLTFGTDEQKRQLMAEVLATPKQPGRESNLLQMIKDQYANYVLQKFMEAMKGQDYLTFIDAIGPELVRAKKANCTGKQITTIEKKMPAMRNGHYTHDSTSADSTDAGASASPS